MRFLRKILSFCTAGILLASCVDADYDIKKVNKDITLFSGGVSIPLGSTAKIRLSDIVGDGISDFLRTESDGTYALHFTVDTTITGHYSTVSTAGPTSFTADLSELPGVIKDKLKFMPDLVDPALKIAVSTDFTVQGTAVFTVMPYTDGKPGEQISFSTDIPYSASSALTITKRLYICNSDKELPPDCEYVKCDLSSLLKNIPDSLVFSYSPVIDADKAAAAGLNATYTAGISCEVNAPLRFGNDFYFCVSDTLDARGVAPYIADNNVIIGGEVASTMPVQADMEMVFLNGEYQEIALRQPILQHIAAGGEDGSEVRTGLNISIDPADRDAAADIQWIELRIKALPSDIHRAFKESDYLQASLYLTLPDGYNIDINSIR